MACESILTVSLVCSDSLMAGVSKVYLIAAKDLSASSGSTYTLATNGMINNIGVASGKTFVEIGVLKNTAGGNETGVFNENATRYKTVEVPLQITDITADSEKFIDSVFTQDVAGILKSASGKYFAFGLQGGIKLSAYTKSLGVASSDLIGYTLTFSGNDTLGLKLTESSAAIAKIG